MTIKILGLEFAPLSIPKERRLQTLSVLIWTFHFIFMGFFLTFLTCYLLFTKFYWITTLYFYWYFYDREQSSMGGRRYTFIRNLKFWNYFRDYFPIQLIKTADLDPGKNYICGYHPHGVLSAGAFCNFGTEATHFSEKFPGIKPHLLVLKGHFQFPVYREYIMWTGICDVSKKSINYILNEKGTGNAIVIVIGGAGEALDAHAGKYDLTLKNRKGFIKLALRNGASLVPIFSFGENDLFSQVDNPQGSRLRTIQNKLKNICGFSPPIVHGRGVFNYSFGLIPYRKPVTTIIGKPIDVEKVENPTEKQVDELHAIYIQSLNELFNENKVKHGCDENLELQIL